MYYMAHISSYKLGLWKAVHVLHGATHVFCKLGCWISYGIIYLFILYVLVHDTSEIILQESGPKRLSIR
jgi:hypothetical protein